MERSKPLGNNEFKGRILFLMVAIFLLRLGTSCREQKQSVESGSEESLLLDQELANHAEDWSQLFIRNEGWFGGDGIFGIPLDGKEFVSATDSTLTLFTFGDTMIGHHDGDTLLQENFTMINNSVGILEGKEPNPEKIRFHWKAKKDGSPMALFSPNTPTSKPGDYYWLGDGFVNAGADETLYIFSYPVQEKDTTGIGGFAFEQIGVNLLAIPKASQPPYENHRQMETPFFDAKRQTTFGSAVYVNTVRAGAPRPDGYIYVYGVSNEGKTKGLLAARVKAEKFVQFDAWRFWNGSSWVPQMDEARFIAEHVSNEMSVSPLKDGRIAITYQFYTMSPQVAIQIGKSPIGPFGERQVIHDAMTAKKGESYFTYNAKAYPHLSTEDSLLISYNVNSFDFWSDILSDPNLYRPRFVRASVE